MAGYNFSVQYLRSKDNVCADVLSRIGDASRNNVDPLVDLYDRNYLISAINSNLSEPKDFASYKNSND